MTKIKIKDGQIRFITKNKSFSGISNIGVIQLAKTNDTNNFLISVNSEFAISGLLMSCCEDPERAIREEIKHSLRNMANGLLDLERSIK